MIKHKFIETLIVSIALLIFVFFGYIALSKNNLVKKITDFFWKKGAVFFLFGVYLIVGLFAIFAGVHSILNYASLGYSRILVGVVLVFAGFLMIFSINAIFKEFYRGD